LGLPVRFAGAARSSAASAPGETTLAAAEPAVGIIFKAS
jgi:hypothetical protein